MSIIIRRAIEDDISAIILFNKEMALETENLSLDSSILKKGVRSIFNNPQNGFYIVAEINGSVRGCLMITYEWSDWRNGLFWWIQSVYVQKGFRQQGMFKLMYTFIKTLVDKNNEIVGIRLYVDKNNKQAQDVYSKLGMEKLNYELFEYNKN